MVGSTSNYKKRFEELIGKGIPAIETYPYLKVLLPTKTASTKRGCCTRKPWHFFEFIESAHFFDNHPTRILWLR